MTCDALGIGLATDAARRLDEDEKDSHAMTTLGGPQVVRQLAHQLWGATPAESSKQDNRMGVNNAYTLHCRRGPSRRTQVGGGQGSKIASRVPAARPPCFETTCRGLLVNLIQSTLVPK
jgi:hypothetical protein